MSAEYSRQPIVFRTQNSVLRTFNFFVSNDNPLAIDVERRTTRGRACPQCGGKIIPSNRAVYQSTGDPNAVFAIWQCERCGYEEMSEKPKPAGKAKH